MTQLHLLFIFISISTKTEVSLILLQRLQMWSIPTKTAEYGKNLQLLTVGL